MKMPLMLEKRTRTALDSLSPELLGSAGPYKHEVVWYGISALAHCVVMGQAREVVSKRMPLEEFMAKYQIAFNPFSASLRAIQRSGIFIPEHAFKCWPYNVKGRVWLFHDDCLNRYTEDYLRNSEEARKAQGKGSSGLPVGGDMFSKMAADTSYPYRQPFHLACKLLDEHSWQASDFKDPRLIEDGIRVGKDLWRISFSGFIYYLSDQGKHPERPKQPERITKLAYKFLWHYDKFVSEF